MKEGLRKGQLVVWAILTFGLAWGLFAYVMPIFNRAKMSSDAQRAFPLLMVPFLVQVAWFVAGAAYASFRKKREVVLGILLGFGLEFLALAGLIIYSASSHY